MTRSARGARFCASWRAGRGEADRGIRTGGRFGLVRGGDAGVGVIAGPPAGEASGPACVASGRDGRLGHSRRNRRAKGRGNVPWRGGRDPALEKMRHPAIGRGTGRREAARPGWATRAQRAGWGGGGWGRVLWRTVMGGPPGFGALSSGEGAGRFGFAFCPFVVLTYLNIFLTYR